MDTSIPWSAELRTLAARFGDACAVLDGSGGRLTYRELDAHAHAFARGLINAGVLPGEPIAALLPNGIAGVCVSFGIRIAAAAEVPLSWGYTTEEIEWCARIAGFRHVFTRPERAEALGQIGLAPQEADFSSGLDDGASLPPAPAQAASRILFTSGTTGRPKGVVYRHGPRWIGEQLLKATLPFTPHPGAKLLMMTPFPHGASLLTYAWTAFGGEVIILDGVDTDAVGHCLRRGDVEAIFAPPTVLAKLTGALGNQRIMGVRCIFTGTQALAAGLYEKACAMFGPVVRITYGKTECTNPITWLEPAEVHRWFTGGPDDPPPTGACVGWPAPGVEVEIRPPELQETDAAAPDAAGAEASCTQPDGEIWLRAAHMSSGVIGTAGFEAHGPGGWHRTGDLGHVDARGRLVLTGRLADVIKTGGYRVNPDEIEQCLTGMAKTSQVCITSVPSEYWGETIVAVAERAVEGWIDEARSRVAALSRHKQPRLHLALASLPRNPQGKVSRRQVRQLILQTCEVIDGPYPRLGPRAPAPASK